MSRKDIIKFYNSKEWTQLARVIKEKRGINNGGNYCERCGKRVDTTRNLIAHHKQHLNNYNIIDPNITLNEDNIELICFKCHNVEHNRYVSYVQQKKYKKVYIIYGPPLSGKTTLVNQLSSYGDLVLDVDKIYSAISNQDIYDKPNALKYNMFKIRDNIIEQIRTRYGNWNDAYVIGGYADKIKREKLASELGAELVFCEASIDECLARLEADERRDKKDWEEYILKWFDEYKQ